MATILDKIVAVKREEVAVARAAVPLAELRRQVADAPPARGFFKGLAAQRPRDGGPIKLIAEVKKASPSAGVIRADFDPVAIARAYAAAGATCLSVLTDAPHFQGSLDYLRAIHSAVDLPVLRKDFLIDEHQVIEARVAGADAVLLIAECLSPTQLADLHGLAKELGMDALVEFYEPTNLAAVLACGARLVGVNNRNLHTFQIDLGHCEQMHRELPAEVVFVAESGIRTRADAERLQAAGIDAMLVGESLMGQADIAMATKALLGANA
ncbi:indole-3-glycerol phosphate synthase TrpC [Botrimarina hoheduenensis]|nr:indole-3-glycerol phosphate synthase TrpC [Botrimarina hoheduenensis]